MSASDLAPFVAAVIEDGIVAEMKNKIQIHERERLNVQITGHGGNRIYGETSLKEGRPVSNDCWSVCTNYYNNLCICPFDEESIAQVELRVGGIVLLKQFLMADDRYQWVHGGLEYKQLVDGVGEPCALHFRIVPSYSTGNKSPIHTIYVFLSLATSSSASRDAKITFISLMKSFQGYNGRPFQPEQLFRHFDAFINVNDERGGGTKLTMTFERIVFHKYFISGGMSLLDEIGIQTNPQAVRRGKRKFVCYTPTTTTR